MNEENERDLGLFFFKRSPNGILRGFFPLTLNILKIKKSVEFASVAICSTVFFIFYKMTEKAFPYKNIAQNVSKLSPCLSKYKTEKYLGVCFILYLPCNNAIAAVCQ